MGATDQRLQRGILGRFCDRIDLVVAQVADAWSKSKAQEKRSASDDHPRQRIAPCRYGSKVEPGRAWDEYTATGTNPALDLGFPLANGV
jgi:hypothetical protein